MQNLLQLQAPYNEVKYYIIGDDNAATYFSIGEEDGIVRVARTLNEVPGKLTRTVAAVRDQKQSS